MPVDSNTGSIARLRTTNGSNCPQPANSRSATYRGLRRYRLTNLTTGSNAGPPPWSVPSGAKTKDPDSRTSEPYVRGDRYAVDSEATAPKLEPNRQRPARCTVSGNPAASRGSSSWVTNRACCAESAYSV